MFFYVSTIDKSHVFRIFLTTAFAVDILQREVTRETASTRTPRNVFHGMNTTPSSNKHMYKHTAIAKLWIYMWYLSLREWQFELFQNFDKIQFSSKTEWHSMWINLKKNKKIRPIPNVLIVNVMHSDLHFCYPHLKCSSISFSVKCIYIMCKTKANDNLLQIWNI